MNLAQLLLRSATVYPDRTAIALGTTALCDYREFARRAASLARALSEDYGLAPGDRVGVFLANIPEYLEAMYGIWWGGLVAVPINCKLHPREAAYILDNAECNLAFVGEGIAAALANAVGDVSRCQRFVITPSADYRRLLTRAARPPCDRRPEDPAWLFYTSGTTGRPKGVMLSQRNLLAMTLCYFSDVDSCTLDDAAVYAAPLSHGAGMYNFAHVLAAARHVVPESGGFDAQEVFELAAHHRNASLFAAPTMVRRLVDHCAQHGADPSGIKTVVYGGGPMYAQDIKEALAVMGERFVQIYGQGESPMTITALARRHLADRSHPRYEQRIASVGVAQSAVEVRVADADGRGLPAGEIGEVLVRGDTVMSGYWRDPPASAAALRSGWLYTGDVGSFDDDGFLTLRDRSKDVIISGGSNIYPREIEEVLLQHPAVHEAAVVGRPSREWGEEVVAFVVAKPGIAVAPAELDALCAASIARFKRPKEYLFVDTLPKNNYGKVLKKDLRELLEGEEDDA